MTDNDEAIVRSLIESARHEHLERVAAEQTRARRVAEQKADLFRAYLEHASASSERWRTKWAYTFGALLVMVWCELAWQGRHRNGKGSDSKAEKHQPVFAVQALRFG